MVRFYALLLKALFGWEPLFYFLSSNLAKFVLNQKALILAPFEEIRQGFQVESLLTAKEGLRKITWEYSQIS